MTARQQTTARLPEPGFAAWATQRLAAWARVN